MRSAINQLQMHSREILKLSSKILHHFYRKSKQSAIRLHIEGRAAHFNRMECKLKSPILSHIVHAISVNGNDHFVIAFNCIDILPIFN